MQVEIAMKEGRKAFFLCFGQLKIVIKYRYNKEVSVILQNIGIYDYVKLKAVYTKHFKYNIGFGYQFGIRHTIGKRIMYVATDKTLYFDNAYLSVCNLFDATDKEKLLKKYKFLIRNSSVDEWREIDMKTLHRIYHQFEMIERSIEEYTLLNYSADNGGIKNA